MRKFWPFAFYFIFFAGVAFMGPFMVLYYQKLGFTGPQIGLLVGIPPLITIVSAPFWTGLADRTKKHNPILAMNLLIPAVAITLTPLLKSFTAMFLVSLVFNLFFSSIISFADSATMHMLGNEKEKYGRLRLGGTIGFGIAVSLAGLIVEYSDLRFAFWGSGLLLTLSFLISRKLEFNQISISDSSSGSMRALFRSPQWVLFLVIALVGGMSFSAINTYFFPYLRELGARESTMGLAVTIGTIFELPVFFFGNLLIRRFKAYGLFVLSIGLTAVRLLLFAAAGTPGMVLIIQSLHGLTLPATLMAAVAYADETAPRGMHTTTQGVLGAVYFGIGSAIGGFAGGPLLENLGGAGLYLVFGIITAATLAAAVILGNTLAARQPPMPGAAAK